MAKYTSQWKGLDQGTEHTWQPAVIEAVAKEIARLGTVDYTDPASPLYPSLNALFPGKKWVSSGADGSARTIFRRSNTWAKLGLVETSKGKMRLTPFGESFVIGEISVQDVLTSALAHHEEGTERPFSVIASALLEKPTKIFSLEELEFGVMGEYRPGEDDLDAAFSRMPIPLGAVIDNRKRRMRAILSRLEDINAIANVSGGWIAKDIDALSKIAGRKDFTLAAVEISPVSSSAPISPPVRNNDFSMTFRAFTPSSPTFGARLAPARAADPQRRVELLEKASLGHAAVLKLLAESLQQAGHSPTADPVSYDLAVSNSAGAWIFEVKTCNETNIKSQIRKAIPQLYEYKWRGRSSWPQNTTLIIVLDKSPIGLLERWMFDFLHEEAEILIIWNESGLFKTRNPSTGAVEDFTL